MLTAKPQLTTMPRCKSSLISSHVDEPCSDSIFKEKTNYVDEEALNVQRAVFDIFTCNK